MIDFYSLTSPNVQKIFIMLEECGLPYNQIKVDVWNGDNYKPEFLKVNPNAKIPAIVDHEGPGGKPITVFESGAILMYLADKTGKFMPRDKRAYFEMMQWLMIQLTSVGPMFGQTVHFHMMAPPGNDYAKSRYKTEMLRLYALLEKRLGEAPYLGGQEYSIADIATFPWTRTRESNGVMDADNPNIARWFKAVSGRPAVVKALAEVARITSVRETATQDNKDRLFGRGKFARA